MNAGLKIRVSSALGLLLALTTPAWAHKPSDAQVNLAVHGDEVTGRIDVAVRDLDAALAIDDGDGDITWSEIQVAEPRIEQYIATQTSIDGPAV